MQFKLLSLFISFFTLTCSAISFAHYPTSIHAENGVLTIQKKPERIIVLEFGILDELKLLGVKPIGIGKSDNTEGQDPLHLQDFIKDIASVAKSTKDSDLSESGEIIQYSSTLSVKELIDDLKKYNSNSLIFIEYGRLVIKERRK